MIDPSRLFPPEPVLATGTSILAITIAAIAIICVSIVRVYAAIRVCGTIGTMMHEMNFSNGAFNPLLPGY